MFESHLGRSWCDKKFISSLAQDQWFSTCTPISFNIQKWPPPKKWRNLDLDIKHNYSTLLPQQRAWKISIVTISFHKDILWQTRISSDFQFIDNSKWKIPNLNSFYFLRTFSKIHHHKHRNIDSIYKAWYNCIILSLIHT